MSNREVADDVRRRTPWRIAILRPPRYLVGYCLNGLQVAIVRIYSSASEVFTIGDFFEEICGLTSRVKLQLSPKFMRTCINISTSWPVTPVAQATRHDRSIERYAFGLSRAYLGRTPKGNMDRREASR